MKIYLIKICQKTSLNKLKNMKCDPEIDKHKNNINELFEKNKFLNYSLSFTME